MIYTTNYRSPIGSMLLAATEDALIGAWFEGQKYYAEGVGDSCCEENAVLLAAKGWLDRYFAGKKPEISELPLAPMGSAFRKSVCAQMCAIPYGETVTYGQIAARLNCRSAQAVGGAVGHNSISVIIPCHRVLGAGDSMTGYAGGIDRKQFLLELERD